MSTYNEILLVELKDIIDSGREHPLLERKSWLNLKDNTVRAKTARHLCALSNSGGGWLILGAADEGGLCDAAPDLEATSTQDEINDIVAKYLDPSFHCERHIVTWDERSLVCHAYRVPSHEATPVCAKRDGPQKSSRPQGISTGTHYVRSPKPASVPINSSAAWKPVIDRCVAHQREVLLASISGLLSGTTEVERADVLTDFTAWSKSNWLQAQPHTNQWTTDANDNYCLWAYRLMTAEGNPVEQIPFDEIDKARTRARDRSNSETSNTFVGSFELNAGSPYPAATRLFNDTEVLVREHVHDDEVFFGAPYVWALTQDGLGSSTRILDEDRIELLQAARNRGGEEFWQFGKQLSPRWQAGKAFKFLRFIHYVSESFADADEVEVEVYYTGLRGREIKNPTIGDYSYSRVAQENERKLALRFPLSRISSLAGASEASAALLNPVFRLFDGYEVYSEYAQSVFNR